MKIILYSYRRCPYAMRARMALLDAKMDFEVREISLRNKPKTLIQISPKATVPVMLLENGDVIEQSLDIMLWAYQYSPVKDRVTWGCAQSEVLHPDMMQWISLNDTIFKPILDTYKYPERFPDTIPSEILQKALDVYLYPIEDSLRDNEFIMGSQLTLVDFCLFPFVRQFMRVDLDIFSSLNLKNISRWVNYFESSEIFLKAMTRYPTWVESE